MFQPRLRKAKSLLDFFTLWSVVIAISTVSCRDKVDEEEIRKSLSAIAEEFDSCADTDPARADSLADSVISRYDFDDDSVLYYTLLQHRVGRALSRMDLGKADSLNAIVGGYCARSKPTTHLAYRLRYDNHNGMALSASFAGDNERAAELFERARDDAYRYGLQECYYNVSINVADAYISCRRLPEAAAVLRRGLFICDSLGMDEALKVPFFNALSMIYIRLGDYTSALRFSDDARSVLDGVGSYDRFNFWNNRGNVFYFRRYYEQAGACFDSCLRIFEEGQLPESHRYIAIINRQDIAIRLGEYGDSIDATLRACKDFFTLTENVSGLSYVATLQAQLAMKRDGDYTTAGRLLTLPNSADVETSMLIMRREALRDYYTSVGIKDSVIAINHAILDYKDSLLNNVAAMRVADVELQYKESIREMEYTARHHALQSRLYIAVLLALVLTLIIGIILTLNHTFRKRKDLEFARLSSSLMQEKIRNLRGRLSPHFLMNIAKMLDANALPEDHAATTAPVESIAATLRDSLEMGSRIAVSLDEEVAFVQKCLTILPRTKEICCQWRIDPSVDAKALLIPSMSIQLPVENAVKYAFPPAAAIANPTITITAAPAVDAQRAKGVTVIVEDNGVGMQRAAFSPHGNGYAILTRTISCFNMRNAHAIDMKIHNKTGDDGHGVRITFFFPYDYHYDFD